MAHLIDKSALVAEINRQIMAIDNVPKITDTQIAVLSGNKVILTKLLSFIDTLEVKEVDLDKETTHYLLYEHRSPLNEIMHKADLKSEMQYHKDIENAFKAGFELGMAVSNKVQKGE